MLQQLKTSSVLSNTKCAHKKKARYLIHLRNLFSQVRFSTFTSQLNIWHELCRLAFHGLDATNIDPLFVVWSGFDFSFFFRKIANL